jgi:hypothetical protein
MRQRVRPVKTSKLPGLAERLRPGCDLWIVPNILDFFASSLTVEGRLNI